MKRPFRMRKHRQRKPQRGRLLKRPFRRRKRRQRKPQRGRLLKRPFRRRKRRQRKPQRGRLLKSPFRMRRRPTKCRLLRPVLGARKARSAVVGAVVDLANRREEVTFPSELQ